MRPHCWRTRAQKAFDIVLGLIATVAIPAAETRHGLGWFDRAGLWLAIAAAPSWLLERSLRARERSREERLIPLPEYAVAGASRQGRADGGA